MQQNTKRKIFISHSSKDKDYGEALVRLLRGIGLKKGQIVFTSNPDYGIPINQDIYQYLKEQIYNNAHMLYLLSDNYFESIACMNEMGAAWMMQNENTMIMLPGFEHSNPRFQSGVFNKNQITVGLDDKKTIEQLIKILIDEFSLCPDENELDDVRDVYFDKIKDLKAKSDNYFDKIIVLKEKQDLAQEIMQYDQRIKNNPQDYKLYIRRADLLLEQDKQNYRSAIRDYLYAMFLNLEDIDTYYKILETAAKHNEYVYLQEFADKLCEEFPEYANMFGCRAYIECERRRYKQAIEDCNHAITLGGEAPNRWFYNTRGRCYLAQGKLRDALEDFWKSHERDATYKPAMENIRLTVDRIGLEKVYDEAIKLKETPDYEKARVYFEAILIKDPENEKAILEYGGLHYEAGKWKEALSLWERLLKKQKNCRNYYLCSLVLFYLGRNADAKEYMRLALNYPGDGYYDLAVEQWNKHFDDN